MPFGGMHGWMNDHGMYDSRFQDRYCLDSGDRCHDADRFFVDSVGDPGGVFRTRGYHEDRSRFGRLQLFDAMKRRLQVTRRDRFDHMAGCPVNRRR